MTLLRDVLTAFEEAQEPLRVSDLAQKLNLSPGAVAGMIDFWVRKGQLCVADCSADCGSCAAADCALKRSRLALRYELTRRAASANHP